LKSDAQLKALVNDNIPDLYFLSFSSLYKLKARYGNTSPQVAAAVLVMDEILNQIMDEFSALYDNKLASEIMFLGSKSAVRSLAVNEDLKDAIFPVVQKYVRSQESFNRFFPVIYLEKSSATICDEVGRALPNYVEVYCPEKSYQFYPDGVILQANNNSNTTTTTDRASTFQICLWMSIILILFAYAAVYSLYAMNIGADSLLYRTTAVKPHSN